MAIALFGGNDLILLDGIEVDGRGGEYHTFGATPTQFAIESGAVASDHIVEQADTLEISFVMSNLDEQGRSYGNRAAVLLDALRTRIKGRQLYQVVTRHRLYPSMAVTSIKAEHVGPFTGALRGRISFQEVLPSQLQRVRLPAERTARPGAASQIDAGRVEGPAPTAAQAQRANRSVLAQLTGG
jgi:hypothetical protein